MKEVFPPLTDIHESQREPTKESWEHVICPNFLQGLMNAWEEYQNSDNASYQNETVKLQWLITKWLERDMNKSHFSLLGVILKDICTQIPTNQSLIYDFLKEYNLLNHRQKLAVHEIFNPEWRLVIEEGEYKKARL